MWDEGIYIYDTPGVHDNFPSNSTILINEKKNLPLIVFLTPKSHFNSQSFTQLYKHVSRQRNKY